MHKAMGDVKAAVEEINKILKLFPADAACWQELGEMYLSLCDYQVKGVIRDSK